LASRAYSLLDQGERLVVAEESFGMLRDPQHERKINNDINSPPFILSPVEGVRKEGHGIEPRSGHIFQQSAKAAHSKGYRRGPEEL
jgi:hypothetical protein